MQFILDNISAIIVATAVTLLILSNQFNAQRSATEQSIAYMAKRQTLDMASYLEMDLIQIGDGTDEKIDTLINDSIGNTTEFSFWRQDDFGLPVKISYTLAELDSVEIGSEWNQLYRMDRTEGGVPDGGGSSSLIHFTITMLDETGSPTMMPDDARLIRVAVVNAYPYGRSDDMYLFRSFWGITLQPPEMQDPI